MAIPNTHTFTLRDVCNEVGGTSLRGAFANSIDDYFDPAYKGAKDRLSNFRNYPHWPDDLGITGTIEDLPDWVGDNPLTVSIDWSLYRDAPTGTTVYARMLITGTGITPRNYSLGYMSFAAHETKTGTKTGALITSTTGNTTTVILQLQLSHTADFAILVGVATSTFEWTDPGLV